MWISIVILSLYAAVMSFWVQHLMVKQARDNKERVEDNLVLHKRMDLMYENERILSQRISAINERLDAVNIAVPDQASGPCHHMYRQTTDGMYLKCMHCGQVKERD